MIGLADLIDTFGVAGRQIETLVLVVYFGVLGLLSIFGLHRLHLVWLYWRNRGSESSLDAGTFEPTGFSEDVNAEDVNADEARAALWPVVTVQLPIFNELYVVERLLAAIAALDYPRDRLDIQVLDDSTDGTRNLVARRVRELREKGYRIEHHHRRDRAGFKAGALAAGLQHASGELICIFDADFVPPADFLRRTLGHFDDSDVGLVQVRWGHLNRDHSLLTRLQAMLLDAHFVIEQAARNRSGRFFNFNGTAGVWRRQAIDEAGGWQHDTLTEDLDLSYRAQLAGWRFRYVDTPVAPAELPTTIAAFKSQQHRWTKGAVQTARKLLGRLWRSSVPLRVKVEGTFHMTANVVYPLMVALSLIVFPAMLLRLSGGARGALMIDLPILIFGTGAVGVFYLAAQHEIGRPLTAALLRLPALMALGIGISLNNTLAVLDGCRRATGEFVRTPKLAIASAEDNKLRLRRSYRTRRGGRGWLSWVEAGLAAYFAVASATAVGLHMWVSLPFLLLFLSGYLYTAGCSWRERAATA